jgi:hypothetical protein
MLALPPTIQRLAIKRLVRYMTGITTSIHLDHEGHVRQCVPNQANRLARHVLIAEQVLA